MRFGLFTGLADAETVAKIVNSGELRGAIGRFSAKPTVLPGEARCPSGQVGHWSGPRPGVSLSDDG